LKLRILSLSDEVVPLIYSPRVGVLYGNADILISCGDLPYHYLDYVSSHILAPFYFVQGNHVPMDGTNSVQSPITGHGGVDLHLHTIERNKVLLAGIGGSLQYSKGTFQFTQYQMWLNVYRLVPRLLLNKLRYRKYLDIFVSHAPPLGIHDQPDLPHRGIAAFLWFDRVFQPRLHLHGHIHYYHPDTVIETMLGQTRIINTYRYQLTEIVIK